MKALALLLFLSLLGCNNATVSSAKKPTPVSSYKLEKISSINGTINDQVAGSISMNGILYFFASTGRGGKLFSYDGTTLKQISNTNPNGGDHHWDGGFHSVGGALYFSAYDKNARVKLYRYKPGDPMVTEPFININTTKTGNILPKQVAHPVADSVPLDQRGDDHPLPNLFRPVGMDANVYFTAFNGTKYEVYKYTPLTKTLVVISNVAQDGSDYALAPYILGYAAGALHFACKDSNGDLQLYTYANGDPIVTTPVSTFDLGADYSTNIPSGTILDGDVYFAGPDGKLYVHTPGTTTVSVLSDTSGGGDDSVSNLVIVGHKLYFSAVDGSGARNIYKYESGDPVVTAPIADMCGGVCVQQSYPMGLIGGYHYFTALGQSDSGMRFFRSTGMAITTEQVFVINTVSDDQPRSLTVVGDSLYFVAHKGYFNPLTEVSSGYYKIYRLKPGSNTPTLVSNVSGNGNNDDPQELFAFNGRLYFTAIDNNGYRRLYRHKPGDNPVTTAKALSNTSDGADDQVSGLVQAGGKIYFYANDNTGTQQTYAYSPGGQVVQSADYFIGSLPDREWIEGHGAILIGGTSFFAGGDLGSSYVYEPMTFVHNKPWIHFLKDMIMPTAYAAPVDYAKMHRHGIGFSYIRINNDIVADYVRMCDTFGTGSFANANGTALFSGIYVPGTDNCGLLSMGPNDDLPTNPFPDLGRKLTEFGKEGEARVWNDPNHLMTYFSAGVLRPSRSISTTKLFGYDENKNLTMISPNTGGEDTPQDLVRLGKYIYFTINTCGGRDVISSKGNFFSCRKLYKLERVTQ